mmetsp:Transcript_33071/g.58826  ORF Transcript_33071/g.58826 Transcript_33071/m.58826 type:complete len:267 (-) Transcript_33071:49-849(-)
MRSVSMDKSLVCLSNASCRRVRPRSLTQFSVGISKYAVAVDGMPANGTGACFSGPCSGQLWRSSFSSGSSPDDIGGRGCINRAKQASVGSSSSCSRSSWCLLYLCVHSCKRSSERRRRAEFSLRKSTFSRLRRSRARVRKSLVSCSEAAFSAAGCNRAQASCCRASSAAYFLRQCRMTSRSLWFAICSKSTACCSRSFSARAASATLAAADSGVSMVVASLCASPRGSCSCRRSRKDGVSDLAGGSGILNQMSDMLERTSTTMGKK